MGEIWFYHLQHQPLERALPKLVEKSRDRGWRVVIQTVDDLRLKLLDDLLWTYDPASFLPHGTDRDGDPSRHPILLTTGTDTANNAAVRIFVNGAPVDIDEENSPFERMMLIFDGSNEAELSDARRQWSCLKARGFTLAYWQQDENGRWSRKM